MRLQRLYKEYEVMQRLAATSSFVTFASWGSPPERYVVTLACKGLVKAPNAAKPVVATYHQFEIYLHANFPRIRPRLTWLTDIFHPNILSPTHNGGVCVGPWTPAVTLDLLCIRVAEMVQYKIYNTEDALDLEAAAWARQFTQYFPVDTRAIL